VAAEGHLDDEGSRVREQPRVYSYKEGVLPY
jgi:hypothetical protein